MTQSATEAQPKAKKNKLSSGFFRFVLTRFLLIIPTVFILVTIVFFVMRATGDPISAALGGRLTPEELQKRIHAAGYDRPLIVQYIDYLGGLLHGDLGTTLTDNQKVSTILTHYGAATFELAFLALIVALIVASAWDASPHASVTTRPMRASAPSPSCAMPPGVLPRPDSEAHLRHLAERAAGIRALIAWQRDAVLPTGLANRLLYHRRDPVGRHVRVA